MNTELERYDGPTQPQTAIRGRLARITLLQDYESHDTQPVATVKIPVPQIKKKTSIETSKRERNLPFTCFKILCHLLSFSLAVVFFYLSYKYLVAWPVYRLVSFVCIAILWSNVASSVARMSPRKRVSIGDTPALTMDTAGFLQVVKASLREQQH